MAQWVAFNANGVAKYAFAGSGAHQIPLDKGQRVTVEKKCQGWLRGTAMNADGTPGAKGMFPESYIQIEANPPPPRSPKPAPPRPKPGPPAASPQSSASAISPVKRTSAAASPRESKSKKKKSPSKEKSGKSSWAPVQRTGIVEYKFVANGKYQISLQKGAKVFVKTQAGGWYKGNLLDDPTVKGIFPQSYVKLLDDEPQPPAPAQGAAIASTSSLNAMEPKPKPPPGSPSQDTMTASTSSLNVPEPRVSRQRTASVDPGGPAPPDPCDTTHVDHKASFFSDEKHRRTGPVPKASTKHKHTASASSVASDKSLQYIRVPRAGRGHQAAKSSSDMRRMEDTMTMQALTGEIELCMSQWLDEANEALAAGKINGYQRVQERITTLLELRTQLVSIPPEDVKTDFPPLRKHIIQLIEKSRKMVVGFMVPRNDKGMLADTANTTVMDLLSLHTEMYRDELKHHFGRLSKNKHSIREKIYSALGRKPEVDAFQFIIECNMVITTVKEEFHLAFSIWDGKAQEPLTEDFSLTYTMLGMSKDVLKNKTIFADLTLDDFDKDLYLVCRVYRNGSIILDRSKKAGSTPKRGSAEEKYRRPFFVSMCRIQDLNLGKILREDYTPNKELVIRAPVNELKFAQVPKFMMNKKFHEVKQEMEAKQVVITCQLRNATLADTVAADDRDLEGVRVSRKLTLPEVFKPSLERNDLFIWLNTGRFLQGSKKAPLNVQIVIKVFLSNGQQVRSCIQGSGNPDPQDEFKSSVYYHSNTPPWNEITSLKISPDELERAHLQFSIYHASTNKKHASPLSFGWLPLTGRGGAIIPDKEHSIMTYKLSSKKQELKDCRYLQTAGLKLRRQEEIRITTRLLSTQRTQNPTLHALLKWQSSPAATIEQHLKTLATAPYSARGFKRSMRIMLNMLFNLLQHRAQSQNVHKLALKALFGVLSQLGKTERRMMEEYIQESFDFSDVHTTILRLAIAQIRAVQQGGDSKTPPGTLRITDELIPLAKSIDWVVSAAMRSFQLDSGSGGRLDTTMRELLDELLSLLRAILATPKKDNAPESGSLEGFLGGDPVGEAQSALIGVLPRLVNSLDVPGSDIYTPQQLAQVAVSLVASICPGRANNVLKMNLVRILVTGTQDDESKTETGTARAGSGAPCGLAFRPASQKAFFPLLLKLFKDHLVPRADTIDECALALAIVKKLLYFIQQVPASPDDPADAKTQQREAGDANNIAMTFAPVLSSLAKATITLLDAKRGNGQPLPEPSEPVRRVCGERLASDALTAFIAFLYVLDDANIRKHIASLEASKERPSFLCALLDLAMKALEYNLYPPVWVVLVTLQARVVSKVYKVLCPLVQEYSSTAARAAADAKSKPAGAGLSDAETEFIEKYFGLGALLLKHPDLRIENMNKRRRRHVKTALQDADPRVFVRDCIQKVWGALDGARVEYTRVLVPCLFEVLLLELESARAEEGKSKSATRSGSMSKKATSAAAAANRAASNDMCFTTYCDMITTEFSRTRSLDKVERYTIDMLYEITHNNQQQGETFFKMLEKEVEKRFKGTQWEAEPGREYLETIRNLFQKMSSLLKFPSTPMYETERTRTAIALLDYLREEDEHGNIRKGMYFRYVNFLVELHSEINNHVEAGITQLLQIDLLEWSDNVLEASGSFPKEKERERKERLLQYANSFFTSGQDWERAVTMCTRLRRYYEFISYDYEKLSRILQQEATLFHKIASTPRFFPSYYRVVFHGKGFENEKDGEEFVYRGGKIEKVRNFTQRIQRKYPNAKLVMMWEPKKSILDSSDQVISIVTLKLPLWTNVVEQGLAEEGEATETKRMIGNPHVPEPVLEYFENNKRRVFLYAKPVQKSKERKPANEFKELWIQQTYLITEEAFPTIKRRCRVVEKKQFMLTPVENACDLIGDKSRIILKEMHKVRRQAAKLAAGGDKKDAGAASPMSPKKSDAAGDSKLQVNSLLSMLQGTIDAAVCGGSKLFCEAFLVPEYLENVSPDGRRHVDELRERLGVQTGILREGLELFGQLCPAAYKPLLEHLNKTYGEMVDSLKTKYQVTMRPRG